MEKVRTIAGILALLWMCVIFAFSAQEQEESGAVSISFSYQMVSSGNTFFHWNLDEEEMHRIASSIENIVRKAAHMTEYAILSILLFIWLGKWQFSVKKRSLFALILTVLYAASDETHQLFVRGRAGRVSDVLIDSAGAILGLLLFIGVTSLINSLMTNLSGQER